MKTAISLVLGWIWLACAASAAAQAPAPDAIRALVAEAAAAPAHAGRPYDERGWLERFYAPRGHAPAWNPRQAAQALALLEGAPEHGLDPRDYGAAGLSRLPDPVQSGDGAARLDVGLSAAMLRYMADLRVGRARSEYHTPLPDPRLQQFDPVERLRAALEDDSLGQAIRAAQSGFPLYDRIRAALAHYRELARLPPVPLPRPAGGTLSPGQAYPGAAALHERLLRLGDLGPDPAPDGVYTQALAEGVRRFQARHGLADDGILAGATLAALEVPLERRVRQLELALERLRWLPDFAPGPLIAVNLPSYRLWAFLPDRDAMPLEMRVVVGTAVKTPTPLFVDAVRQVEFNPYWNIPRSIVVKEILPKLMRSPGYLKRNDMEVLDVPAGMAATEALRSGKARLRQRPGPRNALGAVKFVMPNPMNIYLHSTPHPELFRRARRDLSHGCIRVEDAAALARFVLSADPAWGEEPVRQALLPGPTLRVDLAAPIPVAIFYATAVVGPDGVVHFAPDIYKLDATLEKALARRAVHGAPEVAGAGRD